MSSQTFKKFKSSSEGEMEKKGPKMSSLTSPTQKSSLKDVFEDLQRELGNVEDEMFGKVQMAEKRNPMGEVKNNKNWDAKFPKSEGYLNPNSFLNLKSKPVNLGPKPKHSLDNKPSFAKGVKKTNTRKRLLFSDAPQVEQAKKIRM